MPQEINNYMKIKEAMENPYNETNNLYELSVDGSLLDMLLEIERVLDESHLYAYENWKGLFNSQHNQTLKTGCKPFKRQNLLLRIV